MESIAHIFDHLGGPDVRVDQRGAGVLIDLPEHFTASLIARTNHSKGRMVVVRYGCALPQEFRVGADPEVFYSSEGEPIATFNLAFKSSKKKTV